MKKIILLVIITIILSSSNFAAPRYIRTNQVGYLPQDTKIANLFSNDNLAGATFSVIRISDGAEVFGPASIGNRIGNAYCNYTYHYKLDFSSFTTPGLYKIVLNASPTAESYQFTINNCIYSTTHETILNFLRAQRCGYNPYLGVNCHTASNTRKDARAVGGPNAGAIYNAEGGWHDAGDYIKFMINNAAVTFMLLFAYKENPTVFADNYLANGQAGSNGVPDVLDEAKYGLDWIMKMHPSANEFYYQVADDIDHNQWRLPQNDTVNGYSTSPYRPMYHCDAGRGANVAGKAAAALALAYIIWNGRGDTTYANMCLTHAEQIYAFGKSRMSAQPSIPSYFYNETTFYDDMELAAAELYKATGNSSYLTDAQNYATQAGSAYGWTSWGTLNFYAHYELYPLVNATVKNTLKGYMQSDLNSGLSNLDVFGMNTTQYVWGSMALLTCNILNAYLYKKLFPSETIYDTNATLARDYLLGKNQWSVCFIVGLGTDFPNDPHHQIARINNVDIFGMTIEGPVTQANWNSYGARAPSSDPYAAFQSSQAIFYDYWEDYSTNEPTIWQAGSTLPMLSLLVSSTCFGGTPTNTQTNTRTSTATFTRTNTITNTITNTPTNTITNTSLPSLTATASMTASMTASHTATSTNTLTYTRTNTATATNTIIPTNTRTNTATNTFTNTGTRTATQTFTATEMYTMTNTVIPSSTNTMTNTNTGTYTPTSTQTVTGTQPATWTATTTTTATSTFTFTNTFTSTFTQTMSFTSTPSLTLTFSRTFTPTWSFTSTFTFTASFALTPTLTFTQTKTNTQIPTMSFTETGTNTPTLQPTNTATKITEEELKIEIEQNYPNPLTKGLDMIIKVKINKEIKDMRIKVYTNSFRLIKEIYAKINPDNTIKVKEKDINNLGNGTYYYVVTGRDEKGNEFTTKIKSFIIIK